MLYDLAVVGGGPGGYSAAIRAAQLGLDVVLIEKDKVGGTCVNRGCIPTKALIQGVENVERMKESARMGLKVQEYSMDFGRLNKWKDRSINTLRGGLNNLFKNKGIEVIKDKARVTGEKKVYLEEAGQQISAENIVLAMGSVPAKIPIPGLDLPGVITSREILNLEQIPDNLIVIGGGYIGLEFAYIYNGLGSQVTVIEIEERIVPFEDDFLAEMMQNTMQEKGISFLTSTRVEKIEQNGDRLSVFHSGQNSLTAQKVLLAVGRQPNIGDSLEIDLIEEDGHLKVDDYMQTSSSNIYAIGDLLNTSKLAHTAFAEGFTAVENIAGNSKKMNYRAVPRVIYTHPSASAVGLTEREAAESYNIETYTFPYHANGKAVTMGAQGAVKIIKENKYDEVLGVHIFGDDAAELISIPTLGLNLEITTRELSETILPHPTLSETIMEAASMAEGGSIHF